MKETWYEITDYKDVENGKYFVSDMGRVKKVDEKLETILKQHPNLRGGYLCVSLYSSASQKTYYRTVHSLIKYYIFKITDNTVMINHIDGDKRNNELCNLELSNALHNTHHAIDNGLFNAIKVTDNDIVTLRLFVQNNPHKYNYNELANMFNLKILSVHRIIKGTIRKHDDLEDLCKLIETKSNRLYRLTPLIREEFKKTTSIHSICKKFKVDYTSVKNIAQDIIREYSIQTSTTSETNKCNSKENKTQLCTKGLA